MYGIYIPIPMLTDMCIYHLCVCVYGRAYMGYMCDVMQRFHLFCILISSLVETSERIYVIDKKKMLGT